MKSFHFTKKLLYISDSNHLQIAYLDFLFSGLTRHVYGFASFFFSSIAYLFGRIIFSSISLSRTGFKLDRAAVLLCACDLKKKMK